ncbi:hypothetical protein ADUPG1_011860 [Aduncisulcus paluster]|uniref:Alpha-MPP n=1 Tax=Aduncisulcus paluster TaxID=2918883 RepID=A0ABQ5JXF3_9EUKA|nr:hypothetical protein ADUPG1_011860 [Aduncisulcus paluster]
MLQSSIIDHGIRVITVPSASSPFLHHGLTIKNGSARETSETCGYTHFLEHAMFHGTKCRENLSKITREVEETGGSLNAATSRGFTFYLLDAISPPSPRKYIDNFLGKKDLNKWATGLLGDMVFNSRLDKSAIDIERGSINNEAQFISKEPYEVSVDLLHYLAFHPTLSDKSGLCFGRPVLGPHKNISSMTPELLKSFISHITPSDCIYISVGDISHEDNIIRVKEMLEDVDLHPVLDIPPSTSKGSDLQSISPCDGFFDASTPMYSGQVFVPRPFHPQGKGPTVHVSLGIRNILPTSSPAASIAASSLFSTLFGRGGIGSLGSFDSLGPCGRRIASSLPSFQSLRSFNTVYDAGIFCGVTVSVNEEDAVRAIDIIGEEINGLFHGNPDSLIHSFSMGKDSDGMKRKSYSLRDKFSEAKRAYLMWQGIGQPLFTSGSSVGQKVLYDVISQAVLAKDSDELFTSPEFADIALSMSLEQFREIFGQVHGVGCILEESIDPSCDILSHIPIRKSEWSEKTGVGYGKLGDFKDMSSSSSLQRWMDSLKF